MGTNSKAVFHESRGFFEIEEQPIKYPKEQHLKNIEVHSESVVFSGNFEHGGSWILTLHVLDDDQLRVCCEVHGCNRILFVFSSLPQEHFFGFGEQLSILNFKGHRVPILSQEPGIGRGVEPLTWIMNTFFKAGGSPYHSNAPAPLDNY